MVAMTTTTPEASEPAPETPENSMQAAEAAAPRKKPAKRKTPYAVYGTGATDPVHMKQIVYKNPRTRKSLSVVHVQRALAEQGFEFASVDNQGYYGDYVKQAVASFQESLDQEATGHLTWEQAVVLFEGDPNVELTID
jgi:pyruvate/2-oxoglutarate dehydrogenase complex dihydrolipoamide acyltransferase (E2) component